MKMFFSRFSRRSIVSLVRDACAQMKRKTLFVVLAVASPFLLYALTVTVINGVYDVPESAAPANPASGFDRMYNDSTTHLWTCLTSSGTSCAPSGGGGGFIQALTAPVHGNFSQINFSGTGVTTTEVDGTTPVTYVTIRQQDATHTGNLAALSKAKLAATFTVTEALSITGDPSAGMIAGLWLNDSGTNSAFYGVYLTNGNNGVHFPFIETATVFNNAGSGASTVYNPFSTAQVQGPLLWLRIQETASARNYYTSSDGTTFFLMFTESNTAHFTTSKYGWGLFYFNGGGQTYDGGITCYSFVESNP